MSSAIHLAHAPTSGIYSLLLAFCFPEGENPARLIKAVRATQEGEMRMSPEARWIPFTAEETIDATRSSFHWEARLDPRKLGSPTVIDAYEGGHGRLAVKLGGILPVKKVTGTDADQGEIQRYLASVFLCPAILLNHSTLEFVFISPFTLRLRDRQDPTASTVDVDISREGAPLACHAIRPRIVGKEVFSTPWTGTAKDFREYSGLRIAREVEAAWELKEGTFTYFRERITSFAAIH